MNRREKSDELSSHSVGHNEFQIKRGAFIDDEDDTQGEHGRITYEAHFTPIIPKYICAFTPS
jgi:hypothetical protein